MYDKALLGTRYACYKCGTKFYDLNRPLPTCPECGADQREAPIRDIKALLAAKGRGGLTDIRSDPDDPEGLEDDDDDVGLLDEDDDDDDDDEEEEEEGGEEDW
jgi:hypothetical protein